MKELRAVKIQALALKFKFHEPLNRISTYSGKLNVNQILPAFCRTEVSIGARRAASEQHISFSKAAYFVQ